ncbi:hypothetical protein TRFO_24620 [Tritrichomonas foetus]|uniref:Protein-S-isoprenylcysteine O-methyltransferase n=1 Tax=Tritrichomonas foetus TaxID=1144522 RepID=A0A1J4K8S3_9EUKA|nr:hypothetical protein TRFO_24620 [Tritrichomonas foetus]|eukprot:OHT07280.1 hypothetical protein TRFO_24620 [Tritrichomonas foetus]
MADLTYFQLSFLLIVIVGYHVAEYLLAKHFHPDTTTASSFLITTEYLIAFTVGLVEFLIERYFWASKSDSSSLTIWVGIAMVIVGLYIRFSSIITAGKSFTHLVQYRKRAEHKLITHGIYKYIRHPGYFGFFVFAVGTQIMLKNFFSVIGFICVLWYFFYDRIKDEEEALVEFFGREYIEYRERTPTWIPFIK